jgi:S-adenosylmethionine:diacylglycerol 3-amino-3-carboxypropyl transferase
MAQIYFAQIREDSEIEMDVMRTKRPENVVVIGSGGCTALSILSDDVRDVFCIDLNPAQAALIELKKVGIRNFSRSEFLEFIGEAPSQHRVQRYGELRLQLPKYAREYWDENKAAIEKGINKCGVTEIFYESISREILNSSFSQEKWQLLFTARNIDEQCERYKQHFSGEDFRTLMLPLLSKTNHVKFFPSFMFEQAQEDDFGNFFLHQFEKEISQKPVSNNYFLSQFLFGRYIQGKKDGSPFYLTDAGYQLTRKNLHKLHIIPSTLHETLVEMKNVKAFFLSNVFDWASEDSRSAICQAILASAAKGAVVLYRNMLSEPSLPENFSKQFKVSKELSYNYLKQERSMLYRKITTGEII